MPERLSRFLNSQTLEFHLGVALIAGLALRTLTAYFVYGPLAIDDMNDAIYPALQLIEGHWPTFNVGRSYLLPFLLSGFVRTADFLGFVNTPVSQVRAMYMGLGFLSLTSVIGGYWYAKAAHDSPPAFHSLILYLLSFYFVMPFLGTRAFGETMGMGFVMLGTGLIVYGARNRKHGFSLFGFLSLSLACSFRYQIGILLIVTALIFLWQTRLKGLLPVLCGLLGFLVIQAVTDTLSHRYPLQTFWEHVFINRHGGAEYGSQPWHVHIALLSACAFLPFSLVFGRSWFQAMREHVYAFLPLLAFAAVHTLIAHKEERYMAPVLPALLILFAAAWVHSSQKKWATRLLSPVFLSTQFIILTVVTFSNTQASTINPVVKVQSHAESGYFVHTNGDPSQLFYSTLVLREPGFEFLYRPLDTVEASEIIDLLSKHPDKETVTLFAFPSQGNPNPLKHLRSEMGEANQCEPIAKSQSLPDRIIYALNPTHNARRAPIHYVTCRR